MFVYAYFGRRGEGEKGITVLWYLGVEVLWCYGRNTATPKTSP